jgi:hypothetical protein
LSGGVLVGVLVLVFFLAGIAVGVVTVLAMSPRQAREPGEPDWAQSEADDREADDEEPDGGPGAWPPVVGWRS